jgi:hypothetical protein
MSDSPTVTRRKWPPVQGVGRDRDNDRTLIVYFDVRPTDEEMRVMHVLLRNEPPICGLCALGYAPFICEKIMWHQVNGRDPFRCTTI